MKETPRQYIQRMLGNVGKKNPLAVQRATPERLVRLVRGLSRAQLRRRPAPGKWSINEIVAHLSETELVGGYRIRAILGRNGTPIQAFDQDVWARAGRYQQRDTRRSLALFRALREANLALFRSLSPRQWKQYGMHSERGKETVAHIVRMFAGHDINHLAQIERIKKSVGK
jgi:uncharacterized damage-inducible protein DinB